MGFADRGIVPRAISAIYAEAAARPENNITIKLSYAPRPLRVVGKSIKNQGKSRKIKGNPREIQGKPTFLLLSEPFRDRFGPCSAV